MLILKPYLSLSARDRTTGCRNEDFFAPLSIPLFSLEERGDGIFDRSFHHGTKQATRT